MKDQDVKDIAEALQIQLTRDFCPIWNVSPTQINFVPKDAPENTGVWELVVLDNSDQAGALGYHDLTSNGDPLGKIFAADDLKFGSSVSVTMSHELMEMIGDPNINLVAEVDDASGNSTWYAYETADACEDDSFGYDVTIASGKKIHVSDFVTPHWFQPDPPSGAIFDFMKHITAPLQILQNGYIGINDGSGWSQKTAKLTDENAVRKSLIKPGHRRERRVRGHQTWKRSIKR